MIHGSPHLRLRLEGAVSDLIEEKSLCQNPERLLEELVRNADSRVNPRPMEIIYELSIMQVFYSSLFSSLEKSLISVRHAQSLVSMLSLRTSSSGWFLKVKKAPQQGNRLMAPAWPCCLSVTWTWYLLPTVGYWKCVINKNCMCCFSSLKSKVITLFKNAFSIIHCLGNTPSLRSQYILCHDDTCILWVF